MGRDTLELADISLFIDKIQNPFEAAATVFKELRIVSCSPTENQPRKNGTILDLLKSMGGVTRKALLFIASCLLALKHATEFSEIAAREMACETLDLCMPIANRLSVGRPGLQREPIHQALDTIISVDALRNHRSQNNCSSPTWEPKKRFKTEEIANGQKLLCNS
jgi:hypothetical protein